MSCPALSETLNSTKQKMGSKEDGSNGPVSDHIFLGWILFSSLFLRPSVGLVRKEEAVVRQPTASALTGTVLLVGDALELDRVPTRGAQPLHPERSRLPSFHRPLLAEGLRRRNIAHLSEGIESHPG